MKRKLFLYGILIALSLGAVYLIYEQFRPQEVPLVETNFPIESTLPYSELNQYVYDAQMPITVFFYSSKDTDSQYVVSALLNTILLENNLESFENLVYVDLADLPDDISTNYTKNNWGFSYYPCFVTMQITDEKGLEVLSLLQWDAITPYTVEDVKGFLLANKILVEKKKK